MTEEEDKKSNKNISLEDAALWEAMTGDVQRLPGKTYKEGVADHGQDTDLKEESSGGETILPTRQEQNTRRKGTELDGRTDERLRKGQMEIEARLDLHGMIQDEAEKAVLDFIQRCASQGKRCVLIITGKGKTKAKDEDWLTSKPGVLKRRLPGWLAHESIRDFVLKTYPAQPRDGGDGAFYVYLRRQR